MRSGRDEVELAIDQEVLLLGTAGRHDALRLRAEELQDADRLLRERLHRPQERRLLVERLTGPAHERGRNDERRAVGRHEEPRRAGRIPRRVAARLEGGPHAARREARRVRLALDQFLAAELGDGAAVGRGRQERVVLLGGDAGQRLEPVRVVRGAVLDGPVLERAGDDVGDRGLDRLALGHRAPQRAVHVLGQTGALRLVVERQRAEFLAGLARRRLVPGGPAADARDAITCRCRSHRRRSFRSCV